MLTFIAAAAPSKSHAGDPPPGLSLFPPQVLERDRVKKELRESLSRKYRIDEIRIESSRAHPLGISVDARGDLTPAVERGRPFNDPHTRARSVSRAFLAENPTLMPTPSLDVEIVETRIDTLWGQTSIWYGVRVSGVGVWDARAHFVLSESGQLIDMDSEYPLLSPSTIGEIKAALARGTLSKEDALAVIASDRRRKKPDAVIAATRAIDRFVFPTPPYVRWKAVVHFDQLVSERWEYEVDAETDAIVQRWPPQGEPDESPPMPPAPLVPTGR